MGVLNFGLCKAEVFICRVPSKNPGRWISNELPWQTAFRMCCHNLQLRKSSASYVTPPGEDSGNLCLASPALCPWSFLIFADFALCPFVIIHHSHEHDYILSSASPSSKSPGLEVVLGTPDTAVNVADDKTPPQNLLGLLRSMRYVPCVTYPIISKVLNSKACITCDFG